MSANRRQRLANDPSQWLLRREGEGIGAAALCGPGRDSCRLIRDAVRHTPSRPETAAVVTVLKVGFALSAECFAFSHRVEKHEQTYADRRAQQCGHDKHQK